MAVNEKYLTKSDIDTELVWEQGEGANSAVLKGSNGTAFGDNSVVEGTSVTNAAERGITSASTNNEIITEWSGSTPDTNKFSLAKGEASHVGGNNGLALGDHSHVEGNGCIASNNSAHAEGTGAQATNKYSHAEGLETLASGKQSHSEGSKTIASASSSHAEGESTIANQAAAHAEGINTVAGTGTRPTAETDTTAGKYSHAEGNGTQASGNSSHAEGRYTLAGGESSHVEGRENVASGNRSHAEGMGSWAKGNQSHSEGNDTVANAWASHTEGYNTETGGNYSANTKTQDTDNNNGDTAHAEGNATIAQGASSHSEGVKTFAKGRYSHAEGNYTKAIGESSHAEGCSTTAENEYSHAEGFNAIASGGASHAEGEHTYTQNNAEHAEGRYNKSNYNSNEAFNTRHSIGIGTSDINRKNAFEIMENGDAYLYGVGGYSGTSVGGDVKTLQAVFDKKLSGVTVNQRAATVSGGVASIEVAELPAVTSSDNLKVLQVIDGEWDVVVPLVVYSGEQTPPASLGNNGDIYLQTAEMLRKPDVLYETDGTTGLLGHNQNSFDNRWQLENLDMTPYKCIKAYIKCAATGDSSTYTSAIVVTVPLDPAAMGPTAYMGSAMAPLPFNRNRQFLVTCAVDSTKTKFQVVHENTIWDITVSDANDKGRYCYKIEGWY